MIEKIVGRRTAQRILKPSRFAFLLAAAAVAAAAAGTHARAQHRPQARTQAKTPGEQTAFGIDEPVQQPAKIPDEVLALLKADQKVAACEKQKSLPVTAGWFQASEIHLGKESAPDLIVQPQEECLLGANSGPFWIFRTTDKGYTPALMTYALDMEVVGTRSHGYRDILVTQASDSRNISAVFRFDGKQYAPEK